MVTHSIDAAASCDRVIVLDKGAVMEDGDPNVLMGDQGSMFRALAVASGGE
jgi:ABC-type multidrug transport system fused ATPase/permease subunit